MTGLPLNQKGKRYLSAFLLALPALLGLILFHYWPIFETFRVSLHEYKIYTGELTWNGLGNYATALDDQLLGKTLWVTLKYFLLKVPVQMALALGLALLVSRPGKGIGFTRTIILLPTVTSMVVASTVWGLMFHPNNGLINSSLEMVGISPQLFLRSESQALPSIAVITIWKEVGISMLFFLAGLMGISGDYYDAAKVDGADSWQTFRYVTLPLLKRTTVFVLITSTIAAFKVFVPVKVLTEGSPLNATRVIVFYIYELAFKYSRMAYATTIGVILALILLVVSIVQMRVTREEEE